MKVSNLQAMLLHNGELNLYKSHFKPVNTYWW